MAQFISNVRVKFHKTYKSKLPKKIFLIDELELDYRDHHVRVTVYRSLTTPVRFYYCVSGFVDMYLWSDEYSKLMLQNLTQILYSQVDAIYAVLKPSDPGSTEP